MGKLDATDIPPIVDVETESYPSDSKIDATELQEKLLTFLAELEKKSARTPMVYTSKYFADKYLVNSKLSKYPLWLAEYTNASQPDLPVTWENVGFRIWQKSVSYNIHSETSDFDVFYGSDKAGIYK